MNKSFTTLTVAAALAASLAAAHPAEARGPHGFPVPPPPPGLRFLPPLPPLPPPPFWAGPVRRAPRWAPDRYYGDWIYTGGAWRHHPGGHGSGRGGHPGSGPGGRGGGGGGHRGGGPGGGRAR